MHSLPPMLEFDDVPAAEREAETLPPKKRRGCLLAFLLFFLILVPLGLVILNGPGFRVLARYAGLKAAAAQGLGGDFAIRGNLWTGFTLTGVDFSGGDGETTSLQIEEMSVDYRGFDLLRNAREFNWLNTVRIRKARFDITLPEWDENDPESRRRANRSAAALDLRPLWNLLAADIQIDDLTILVHQGGSTLALENLSLQSPVDGSGELRIHKISLPGHAPLESVGVELKRSENELSLGPLPLLDFGILENLTITVPGDGGWAMQALLGIGEGHLTASLSSLGEASLSLRRSSRIALEKIKLPLSDGAESAMRGSITDLDFQFEGLFDEPSTWKIQGKLIASGTGWGDHRADSLLLTVQDKRLEFNAMRGQSTLRATASVPLELAHSTEDLAALPVDFSLRLDVPSLEESIEDFGGTLPLRGALSLEARDVQFKGRKTLQSGSFLLLSEDLAWNEVALTGGQFAANVVGENLVRLAAEVGLDAENRMRLSGEMDTGNLSYTAEAGLSLNTAGQLGKVLADLERTALSGAAQLDWTGEGNFGEKHHQGETRIALEEFFLMAGEAVKGKLSARYEGDSAVLEEFFLSSDGVTLKGTGQWDGKMLSLPDWKLTHGGKEPLSLRASVPLEPKSEGGFLDQAGPLEIQLSMKDLALDELSRFFSEMVPPAGMLNGELTGLGSFDKLQLDGKFAFRPETTASETPASETTASETTEPLVTESLFTLNFGLAGDVQKPSSWEAKLNAIVAGLQWNGMALENIKLEAGTDPAQEGRPFLAKLHFDQSETRLEATVRLDLGGAETLGDLKSLPLQIDADLAITNFETLVRDFAPARLKELPLSGALSGAIHDFHLAGGSLTGGTTTFDSDSFAIEGQKFSRFRIRTEVTAPDQIHLVANLALDEKNQIEADGGFHLKEQTYEGRLGLNTDLKSDASKLKKILKGRAISDLLPAVTVLAWEGKGRVREKDHAGTLDLAADDLTLAEGTEPLNLKLAGTYTGNSADFPSLEITSRPLTLKGALKWEGRELKLLEWRGQSEGREVLKLTGTLPLDREKLSAAEWFGQDAALALDLKLEKLSVEALSRLFVKEAPVLGNLSLDFSAEGTPAAPAVKGDLVFDRVSVPRQSDSIRTGRLELNLAGSGEKASLSGRFEHPDVQPLVIRAELPFHPGAWALGERKFSDETLSASAKMERSPLAFLATQVPGIESIAGVIALDAVVKGSLSKPQLSGSGVLDIDRLRLKNRNAPSFYDVDLNARFEDKRIILENLRAIVAGGVVEGRGEAILEAGSEPVISLSLTGTDVLVVRNPEVNVRSDLALDLRGPWSKATLSGELGITNSRYFKNFDLLPIGLGSRGGSALPTVERTPRGGGPTYEDLNLGVDLPPFSDWDVNLRLYTKTPFLVRSNIVTSGITADMKIAGTLGRPLPNGFIAIDKGEMSLPFSKINVETGRIEFDERTGFNGAIEFKARGRADRYQINIYLFNRILSPQYVLTSIPPLASEDIISLLATGTTRNELIGEDVASMAATKAATLFLRNLRKSTDKADKPPSLLDLLEDRTELNMGRVNPETGEQTFGGKIRLWKELFFVGDVDADSDYRALFKYVFRFR